MHERGEEGEDGEDMELGDEKEFRRVHVVPVTELVCWKLCLIEIDIEIEEVWLTENSLNFLSFALLDEGVEDDDVLALRKRHSV